MSSFIQTIKTIVLAATLSLGISFVYAWTAPTVAPTGGNTSAPINTSAVNQTKSGTLTLNRTDGVQGLETYGTTTLATVIGNVGIGTATPGAKLEVAGQVKITGGAPGVNKFLTSDATGLASWATLPASGGSQTLSLGGNVLSISGGNSQTFTGWDTNTGDDLTSLTGGTGISISGTGNSRTITNTAPGQTYSAGTGVAISGTTISNTGDTSASDDITSLTGGTGISISGSGNSRTIALPTCPSGSFLQSNGSTYVCTTAQQPIVTDNFFLLSKNTYTGNLGGVTGADQKCLTEVNSNDFYGKPAGKIYAASNVRAFICSTTFCNGTLSNTQYTMGRLGFPLIGGYKFTTDVDGFGPNDSKDWSAGNAFGSGADYWSNRNVISGTKWNNTPTLSDCSLWTSGAVTNGFHGRTNQTGFQRWTYVTMNCSNPLSLVCIVNK